MIMRWCRFTIREKVSGREIMKKGDNKLQIKMIVMDMDGTLLTSEQKISSKTLQALIKAQQQGIRLVLASGRSYKTLTPYGNQLKMPDYDGYFIEVNGAAITKTSTMERERLRQLQKDEILEIFQAALPYEVEVMGVLDAVIYDYIPDSLRELKREYRIKHSIPEDVPWTGGSLGLVTDQRKGYPEIYDIQDFCEIPCEVNKVCMTHLPEVLEGVYGELVKAYGHKYHFARTTEKWVECSPIGVNKGNALLRIAEHLGILRDEIVVFGDGENDLSMFRAAGYSVAMGNAMESVKQAACEVTLDHDSDGIACFLENHQIV